MAAVDEEDEEALIQRAIAASLKDVPTDAAGGVGGGLLRALPLADGSRRPTMREGELELCWAGRVTLECDGDGGEGKRTPGDAAVTSHRLLWIPHVDSGAQSPAALELPLADVRGEPRITNSFFKKTPRVHVDVIADGAVVGAPAVAFAFRAPSKASDAALFHGELTRALGRAAWRAAPPPRPGAVPGPASPASGGPAPAISHRAAGVAGLMRRQEAQSMATDRDLQSAFRDMAALMDKAKDMVALADRLRAALETETPGPSPSSAGDGGDGSAPPKAGDAAETKQGLADLLLTLGIASPVTKQNAGSLFHDQLARQLADFLREPLRVSSVGALTMVDVYCLFNRARGTELVSPEDLLRAASRFPHIQCGMVSAKKKERTNEKKKEKEKEKQRGRGLSCTRWRKQSVCAHMILDCVGSMDTPPADTLPRSLPPSLPPSPTLASSRIPHSCFNAWTRPAPAAI